MNGKQIAENLKQNRDKWMRRFYYYQGRYCVIGLKLHELGVPVEQWDDQSKHIFIVAANAGLTEDQTDLLTRLQKVNDRSETIEELIDWVEARPDVNFPLEELASGLKSNSKSPA